MDIPRTANSIYQAIKDDARTCAAIRKEWKSLAISLATDPNGAARITSSTVNGQTFTASGGMTAGQRLSLLRWIVACIDNGGPISSHQGTYFP